MESLYSLPDNLPRAWNEINIGGATTCARGEDFSFFVYPGRTNKVVIDFMGGGACWNAETCSEDGATFIDSIEFIRERQRNGEEGVYNRNNPDNPLKDWYHVIVPYCTGDIHWGSNSVNYQLDSGESFSIQHYGAINSQAVLDWVADNFESPGDVLMTGCSAGAYGSIYWAPHYKELFPEANFYHLADSGAGIVTDNFFRNSFPNWQASRFAADWVPGLDPEINDWFDLTLDHMYLSVAGYYDHSSFSQFNMKKDEIQKFFYEIMGGDSSHWEKKLNISMKKLTQSLDNFKTYTYPGNDHCILPYNYLYELNHEGVSFLDWFKRYISGESVSNIGLR